MVIPRAGLSRLNFDNGLNKFAYWESPKANDFFPRTKVQDKKGPTKCINYTV